MALFSACIGTHDAVVRVEEGGVHGEVGGRAGVRLHVDAPVVGRQAKGLERAVAAEVLELVDHLVATVVPSSGQALRVLVGHARAEALHHGLGGEVLRRNQLDAVHLALFLLDQNVVHLQSKARRPGACENTAVRLGQAAAVTADGRFSEPPQLTTGSQSFRLASEQEAMVGGQSEDWRSPSAGGSADPGRRSILERAVLFALSNSGHNHSPYINNQPSLLNTSNPSLCHPDPKHPAPAYNLIHVCFLLENWVICVPPLPWPTSSLCCLPRAGEKTKTNSAPIR